MALSRVYEVGTKYLYLKITNVSYSENDNVIIYVSKVEKDSVDPDYIAFVGNQLIYMVDHSGADPFALINIGGVGVSLISVAYDYIKTDDILKDFIDC